MLDLQSRIARIDWSFADRQHAPAIEAIHPYPAKFIGDIPRALLDVLPVPVNTFVFDPFVGSGTTLLEAQRRGIPSVGVDLNPIACLISRVKTAKNPVGLLDNAELVNAAAQKNISPTRSSISNIDHWFKRDVQLAISALLEEINGIHTGEILDALRLALSSILVRVSNQDSDTRYAYVEKEVSKEDVFEQFIAAVKKLNKALLARNWPQSSVTVIEANTLRLKPEDLPGRIGLVITSPPYPNAYEYWLYHKYRMWWLGYDPLAVKEQEIGARAHFFKRKCHTEENFWEQMRSTFDLIDQVLVKRGYACFVIGRSKIHGRIINNADIIQAVAGEHGFGVVSRVERVISSSRKSFNLAHANIKTETVLIMQKNEA
ncbi:RNA methyltransferase [Candidatus Magnetaquiglobus chichijimensis]|uniref:RNA methyltransferase n=1 Tax=Candidatus Magnetaquiglobus chichijimensis TaxID=3141448 RepID=UPI003B977346